MKCGYCNGTGEHVNDANRMTTCEFCGGTGVIKPLTNEEWLDSLPSKDKAIWLTRLYRNSSFNELAKEIQDLEFQNHKTISALIEGWLKEKHNE
jgi:hypothetical protein